MTPVKLLFCLSVLSFTLPKYFCTPQTYPYQLETTLNDSIPLILRWFVPPDGSRVDFQLEIAPKRAFRFVFVGFSPHGELTSADGCALDLLWNVGMMGISIQDVKINEIGGVIVDGQQDCNIESVVELDNGKWIIKWSRPTKTCDEHDYVIKRETTQMLFIVCYVVSNMNDCPHRVVPTRLLQQDDPPAPDMAMNKVSTFTLRSRNTVIPTKRTTYWCTTFELPKLQSKHHVIRYEPVIHASNQRLVHHMEVYLCEPSNDDRPMSMYDGECLEHHKPSQLAMCKRVIAAWAMGASPFVYPKEAGLPLGGDGFYPYAMLEIHYNNEKEEKDVRDSSGMKFYVTSELREFDAGILETGLIYSDMMAIPPKQHDFPLVGFCVPECTEKKLTNPTSKKRISDFQTLPDTGIHIFASQLHAHGTGRRLSTVVLRDGVLIGVVNTDNHYTQHWQEIRPVAPKVTVKPGDALMTTCHYDSSKRDNVTLSGYGIEDEMCVNYMHYYPATNLEVCKSAVNNKTMRAFVARNWDKRNDAFSGQKQKPQPMSKIYREQRWTEQKVKELQQFYESAPLTVECLAHNGKKLDDRKATTRPEVFIWPAVPSTNCD